MTRSPGFSFKKKLWISVDYTHNFFVRASQGKFCGEISWLLHILRVMAIKVLKKCFEKRLPVVRGFNSNEMGARSTDKRAEEITLVNLF